MNKRLIWTLSGVLIGVCITLTSNYATAKITRMKTPEQRAITIQKHEDGLTLKQLDERLTKLEQDVKQLKKGK